MVEFGDLSDYKGIAITGIAMLFIAITGLIMGGSYYFLDQVQTGFESTDCVISGNTLVSSCQELWAMSFYKVLALKEVIVFLSIAWIFITLIGILITGYRSGKNPVMIGLLILVDIGFTYGALHISNLYRTLLSNSVIMNMMIEFPVYNKIMLNFPWFVFIVSTLSIVLGIINFQKGITNKESINELDY